MTKGDRGDSVVLDGLTCTRDIMHVHANGVADAVWEECGGHPASKDRFFSIPRARIGRVRGLENSETLEPPNERAVTEELDRVPMQTRLQSFHGELQPGAQSVSVNYRK